MKICNRTRRAASAAYGALAAFTATLALCALAAGLAPAAQAQTFPSKPIRVVVPFPPGSTGDLVPRTLGQKVQAAVGQPVVIDNRPGAAGAIGADAVAKAAPDGHTVLSHAVTITINPHLVKAPYDLLKDLVPVTQTIAGSYVLVVQPSFPADDLRQLIEVVKKNPGRFNYGSYGSGSGPHLAMEMLKAQAGLFIVHVPFRGAAPAMQELLAGRLEMAFDTSVAVIPHIRAGKLKAIAVGGPRPVDALPGVPTVASLLPGFDSDGWQGLFVPAGTPPEVVARLNAEFAKAVRAPDFVKQMADLGFTAVGSSQAEFAAFVRAEYEKYGRVIRERGIRPD
jgi:tripartite-type tricarboxylate transporter receptor subunit TctC